MSHTKIICCIAVCAAGMFSVRAADTVSSADYQGSVAVAFAGKSTLHDFKGTVTVEKFEIRAVRNEDKSSTSYSAIVDVSVAGMDTANDKRDKTMQGMFEMVKFPVIRGEVTNLVVTAEGPKPTEIQLKIRDKVNTLPVTVSNWNTEGDNLSFQMRFNVSLKAYGLKPPSVMGLIRVADNVTVECAVNASKPKN
jgi:polyisoprenoid-binding protein YceI